MQRRRYNLIKKEQMSCTFILHHYLLQEIENLEHDEVGAESKNGFLKSTHF
jgi:hypothetical protein